MSAESGDRTVKLRRFVWDDLPVLLEVINAASAFDGDDQADTLDGLRERFTRPYFEPERNCFVAVTDAGALVGYCTAELDPRFGTGWGTGAVLPGCRRQGIGTALLRAADARHLERADADMSPDLPLRVRRFARDAAASTVALLERAGYVVVRSSWFMHVELAGLPEPPALPDGITLRPFDRDRDAQAVHAAEADLFGENWGYQPVPFEVWRHMRLGAGFDPGLWLVAVENDAVVGLCLGGPWGETDPGRGWINALGVRTDRRRRGLGSALLRHGFAALRRRGFTAGGLEVDAENDSNAVALYERAGMSVRRRYLLFDKTLRETGE
ncbi:GNAT family N-acetyltransferase [Aggregatilinea lenta]|uniref:GNAT family N-acetyltransferase n=1 Tax=Aggregatilinea lenta TaxID=913108 RepID=UPI000E5A29F9|nr:GNAT family N-acetyltransferase [Aggregatilinea lenta]